MWKLNDDSMSIDGRKAIAELLLSGEKLTQGEHVKKFEAEMAEFVGCSYAVFVSSGSAANSILSHYVKDVFGGGIVVFQSTTWQTTCSPWIRDGFEPHFIDIQSKDLCFDEAKLEKYVKANANKIACVFPTSLIGFTPDMSFYAYLSRKYGIRVMFDNCENTFGNYNDMNASGIFTSTTSTYMGHQLQSIEGGFIFTNSLFEYEKFLMYRNHGMVRSIDNEDIAVIYRNPNVHESFDFYCLGSNYRNTEVNALFGRLNLQRIEGSIKHREKIYNYFRDNLSDKYVLPEENEYTSHVPFCLPIIMRQCDEVMIDKIIDFCLANSIEYRPIVSGFLGYQTCYHQYFRQDYDDDYDTSIFLHNNSIYVGLHDRVTIEMVDELLRFLNNEDSNNF